MSAPLEIFAFADTLTLAEATANQLGQKVRPIEVHEFPDGESLVRIESRRPGRALVFRSLDHPNGKLVELLLAADALRRQGVQEITLVAPYLGYMRQDSVFHKGEPISQRVIARLLDSAFDEVITVEAHLHRIQNLSEVFESRARSFSAAIPISSWLQSQTSADILIGPDEESEPWIRSIGEKAGLPWIVGSKTRRSDQDVQIQLPDLPAGSRSAWIIDDIVSSGATLEAVAKILQSRNILEIGVVVVHALLEADTLKRLSKSGLNPLVSTDSIAHPTNAISLAPFLAEAISSNARTSEAS